jgi:hypothetical protein
MTDARELWRKHGGDQHGPRIETMTIPESNFNAFLKDAFIAALPSMVAPLVWEETWGGEYEDIPGWDARRGPYRASVCFAGFQPRINTHADACPKKLAKAKAEQQSIYAAHIMAAFKGAE